MTSEAEERINHRNIQTLADYIRELEKKFLSNEEKVKHLEGQVTQLSVRLNQTEQNVSVIRIKNLGSGPTAR